jgi:hypothetical protein
MFGVTAVTAMLVFYALEERGRVFVLFFAAACAASSLYGFLQGAWPFGVVEAVWTGVALRRWRAGGRVEPPQNSRPIACDMSALAAHERRRYDALRLRISGSVRDTATTSIGFRLQVDDSISLPEVAEWMALEHRCCPFLSIAVVVHPDGTRWVELGGGAAIKEFLRGGFGAVLH